MNKKEIIIGGIAVVALIVGLLGGGGTVEKIIEKQIGAVVGPEIYSDLLIHGSITSGNGVLATSTTGSAVTLGRGDLANYNYIDMISNTGNLAITLPATSTMINLLPDIGSTRSWLIHNATTTSATTLTITAGAGMDLVSVTANDDVIDGGEWSQLTCTRIYYRAADNEDVMCIVDELANSD